jgi:hypothetical protein
MTTSPITGNPGPSPWVLTDPPAGSTVDELPYLKGTIPNTTGHSSPVNWVRLSLVCESGNLVWDGSRWLKTGPHWLTTDLSGSDWEKSSGLPSGGALIPGKYFVTIQYHLGDGYTSDDQTAWIYV